MSWGALLPLSALLKATMFSPLGAVLVPLIARRIPVAPVRLMTVRFCNGKSTYWLTPIWASGVPAWASLPSLTAQSPTSIGQFEAAHQSATKLRLSLLPTEVTYRRKLAELTCALSGRLLVSNRNK